MKQLYSILIGCSMILGSCADESIPDLDSTAQPGTMNSEGSRSISEALRIAEEFFSATSPTRAFPRVVESVEGVAGTETRSGAVIPSLYLINYADNSGYALIGSSVAAYDIYAISDQGHLALTDTTGNEALSDFLRKAILHSEAMTLKENRQPETKSPIPVGGLVYEITDKADPMLEEGVGRWHQREPFNRYCYDKSPGATQLVGCGPICLGQIMTYYDEYADLPYTYQSPRFGKVTLDWASYAYIDMDDEDLTDNMGIDDLAKSLRIVGDLVGCNYSDGNLQTTSDSKDFLKALTKIGYKNEELFLDQPLSQKLSEVKTFMKNGMNDFRNAPLIFYGVKQRGNEVGHFWVVDGFVERRRKNPMQSPVYLVSNLFHCIWGQKAGTNFNNGYYAYLSDSDMIAIQEYTLDGGIGGTIAYPYYDIMVVGGYKRQNTYSK